MLSSASDQSLNATVRLRLSLSWIIGERGFRFVWALVLVTLSYLNPNISLSDMCLQTSVANVARVFFMLQSSFAEPQKSQGRAELFMFLLNMLRRILHIVS